MSIHLKSITPSKILDLVEQFLSKAEQQWLNKELSHLLATPPLSIDQKQNLVDKLCGTWADDKTILPIFQDIEQQRLLHKPRDISF